MSPWVIFQYSWCFKERSFRKLVTYSPQDNGAVSYTIVMKINTDSGGERNLKSLREGDRYSMQK